MGEDERDYAEEAANRREMRAEGEQQQVPVGITFTLEESEALWNNGSTNFWKEQPDRFELRRAPLDNEEASAVMNDPAFKAMYWCPDALAAHVVAQVHRAYGYRVELLFDRNGSGFDDFVVLSSMEIWPPPQQ